VQVPVETCILSQLGHVPDERTVTVYPHRCFGILRRPINPVNGFPLALDLEHSNLSPIQFLWGNYWPPFHPVHRIDERLRMCWLHLANIISARARIVN
jgi:hypothetical protein